MTPADLRRFPIVLTQPDDARVLRTATIAPWSRILSEPSLSHIGMLPKFRNFRKSEFFTRANLCVFNGLHLVRRVLPIVR